MMVKWTTEKISDKFGIVEIKCPFQNRSDIPSDAADRPRLKRSHDYYYPRHKMTLSFMV